MTQSATRPTRFASARIRALLSLGIVFGLGSVGTMAAWSDTSTATSGTFTTGFIDLQLNGSDIAPTSFATDLKANAMVPGNSVTTNLTVQNQGTVAFGYSVTARASAAGIAPLLSVSISSGQCPGTLIGTRAGLTTADQSVFAVRRPIPARVAATPGADPICVAVSIPATATLPVTPVSGTVTLTFNALST